ncbi:MAG: DUF4383 domain-containing protein [Egibacteraceae bacterium]
MSEQISRAGATSLQKAVAGLSLALLLWSIGGLIVNPDFATGEAATAERLLLVDFNGWHAVSGIGLAVPGLVAALRARWSFVFALVAAVALAGTGVWALFETRPAGLFYFPHNVTDALLHFGFAALYGAAAAVFTTAPHARAGHTNVAVKRGLPRA